MAGRSRKKYHIPSDEEVFQAVINVIKANPVVSSQRKMLWLVLRDLREKDPMYTLSGERLRRIAASSHCIIVETEARETGEKRNILNCPVCGFSTEVIKNQTLYGGTVSLIHRCPRCGYWSGIRYRMPTRYRFLLSGDEKCSKRENGGG